METMIRAVLFDLDGTILDRLSSLRVYLYNQVERLPDVLGRVPFVEYMDRLVELDSRGHGDKHQVFRRIERDFAMHFRNVAAAIGRLRDLLPARMRPLSEGSSNACDAP